MPKTCQSSLSTATDVLGGYHAPKKLPNFPLKAAVCFAQLEESILQVQHVADELQGVDCTFALQEAVNQYCYFCMPGHTQAKIMSHFPAYLDVLPYF